MAFINWVLDGEPIYCKPNSNFPRQDGSTNDVTNRPLREIISNSGLDPDADIPGFAPIYVFTGSPEGVVTATAPCLGYQSDAATGQKLWFKETGSGNTGWVLAGGSTVTTAIVKQTTPIIEIFDTLGVDADTGARIHRFGPVIGGVGTFTTLHDTLSSGGTSSDLFQIIASGIIARRLSVTGQAAASSRNYYSSVFGVPLANQLTALNTPANQRRYRKYTISQSIVVDSQVTNHNIEWGLQNGAGTISFTTQIGIKLVAESGVNSGNYQLVRRLTNGGALSVIASAAVGPTTARRLTFIYTEGLTPTLEVYIDNTLLHTFTGNAEFPNLGPSASASIAFFGLSVGNYADAGATGTTLLDYWDGYYCIEEV